MAKPRPRKDQQLAAAWKAIWETAEGRLAIGELLVATNVYSEIQATDPVLLGIAVGERNMAARIARLIGLRPQDYPRDAQETVDTVGRFIDGH